jgi:hypothetical protein
MALFQILQGLRVARIQVVVRLVPHTNDLFPVPQMAPGIVAELGMEPVMEIFRVQGAVDYVVQMLLDREPRGRLAVFRIQGADHHGVRAVGTNEISRAVVSFFLSVACDDIHICALILSR